MRLSVVLGLMVMLAAPAMAQDKLQQQVYACANIADDGQRHACFDALVPELKKQGQMAASQPAQAQQQQQVANLGLPSKSSALTAPVGTPGAPKPPAEPDKVRMNVTSISMGSDGKARITMENGQVWRQVDTGKLRNIGDGPPWTAEVRKAALGSFLLKLGNSQAVHVERVN